jgi:hypothetical protein
MAGAAGAGAAVLQNVAIAKNIEIGSTRGSLDRIVVLAKKRIELVAEATGVDLDAGAIALAGPADEYVGSGIGKARAGSDNPFADQIDEGAIGCLGIRWVGSLFDKTEDDSVVRRVGELTRRNGGLGDRDIPENVADACSGLDGRVAGGATANTDILENRLKIL